MSDDQEADLQGPRSLSDAVARVVSLVDLRVRRLETELLIPTPKLPLTPKVAVEPTVGRASKYFVCDVTYTLGATDDSQRDIFRARAVLNLIFSIVEPDSVTDEGMEAFGGIGAVEIAHPYVRELVHNLTFRMGLPPFVLDVLPPLVVRDPDAEPPMITFR